MNRIAAVGGATAVLFLLLGTTAPVYGQEDQGNGQQKQQDQGKGQKKQQGKPAQQPQQRVQQQQQQTRPTQQPQQRVQQQQQQTRPTQQPQQRVQQQQQQTRPTQQPQQRVQQQQQQTSYAVPQRSQQQALGWQQQRGWLQQGGGWQGQSSWQQARAQHWQVEHRTWDQRGGYGGYYIPQDRFVLYFGSQHWFRIRSRPIIVAGYPRFQYQGFWFMLVDPWPESWPEGWYDTDDVYVDYHNGYYLYNRREPSVGIAIAIVL